MGRFFVKKDTNKDVSHDHEESTSATRLAAVAIVNLIGFIIEFVGGVVLGSLSLVADSFHMLSDSFSYFIALLASLLATRTYPKGSRTFGLHRAEPIAAMVNGILLIPLFGLVVYHSYERYASGFSINVEYAILVGVAGLIINILSMYVIDKDSDSVNEKTAWRHLAVDAGASVAAIAGLVAVYITDNYVYDIVFALIVSIFILWTATKIFRDSGSILMQFSQKDVPDIVDDINDIEGVESVEDIHCWNTCGRISVITLHVMSNAETKTERESVRDSIYSEIENNGLDHATVEIDGKDSLKNHSH